MSRHKIILAMFLSLATFQTCIEEDIFPSENVQCDIVNQPSSTSHAQAAAFRSLIDEYTAKGLPGISLMVDGPSGVFIGSSGLADIKEKVDLTPCHVTKIASVTKMMVAVLAFVLQEEGKLDVDDLLSKYLSADDLKGIENADKVTLRQLMQHSTGIYDVITDTGFYLQVLNNPTKHWTPEELLIFVRGKKANFGPNESSQYSNTNYLLLHWALEKATNRQVNDLLRDRLFSPLGMSDTYYHWHDPLPENRVSQGYFDLYQNGTIINVSDWNTGSGNGYGGVYSTVVDMDTFMNALLVDKSILSQNSLDEMLVFNEEVIESRKYLGVGLFKDFIDLEPNFFAYGHRGRDLGYSADLFYFPNQNTILSLSLNYGTDSESSLKPIFLEFRDKLALLIYN